MKITDKIARAQYQRPKPFIYKDDTHDLIIILTPWGSKKSTEKVAKTIKDFYISSKEDVDSTSPFNFLMCLTPTANYLRTALKMANDVIFREENRKEFTSGCEAFVLAKNDQEISWAQIGNYFPVLVQKHQLRFLGHQVDLTGEFSSKYQLAPLPGQLLGIEGTSDFSVQSIRIHSGDKLFLSSATHVNHEKLAQLNSSSSLSEFTKILELSQQPYWAGLIEI